MALSGALILSLLLQAVSPIEITVSKKPKRSLECLSEFRIAWRSSDDVVSSVETDVVSIAVEKWPSGSRSARSAIGRLLPVAPLGVAALLHGETILLYEMSRGVIFKGFGSWFFFLPIAVGNFFSGLGKHRNCHPMNYAPPPPPQLFGGCTTLNVPHEPSQALPASGSAFGRSIQAQVAPHQGQSGFRLLSLPQNLAGAWCAAVRITPPVRQ